MIRDGERDDRLALVGLLACSEQPRRSLHAVALHAAVLVLQRALNAPAEGQRHAVAGAVRASLWREGFALMLWISIIAVTDAIASALFDAGHVSL